MGPSSRRTSMSRMEREDTCAEAPRDSRTGCRRLPAMDPLPAPGSGVSDDDLGRLRLLVSHELPAYLEDLATLVNIDCGSYTKAGVDRVGRWTARFLKGLGARSVEPNLDASATPSSARAGRPVVRRTVADRPYGYRCLRREHEVRSDPIRLRRIARALTRAPTHEEADFWGPLRTAPGAAPPGHESTGGGWLPFGIAGSSRPNRTRDRLAGDRTHNPAR